MIRAIFFDIDGTLVTKGAKALESTKHAIAEAQKKGIICGVSTGRGPAHLSEQIDSLKLDVFITYNGQLVYTKKETIRAEAFPEKVLADLVSFSDRYKRQISFGSRRNFEGSFLMRFGQNKWAKKIVRFLPNHFPVGMAKNVLGFVRFYQKRTRYHEMDILKEPIYQCVLLSPESETVKLKERFPDCHFTRSNPYVVDIIPKGGSKIQGIKECVDYYGFSMDEVMAFGDSWNDLEMLKGVGIGVAMGNAQEDIKQIADYVTDSNEEDGIYNAMHHFGVIGERKHDKN